MKKRLLITSIVMMLVVAVALSTATYAWFTQNASVTASTITMKAGISDSSALGIAWTKSAGTAGQPAFNSHYQTSIDTYEYTGDVQPAAPSALTNADATFYTAKIDAQGKFKTAGVETPVFRFANNSNSEAEGFSNLIHVANLSQSGIIGVRLDAEISAVYKLVAANTARGEAVWYTDNDGTDTVADAGITNSGDGTYYTKTDATDLVRIAVFEVSTTTDPYDTYTYKGTISKTAGSNNTAVGAIVATNTASDLKVGSTTTSITLSNIAAQNDQAYAIYVWLDGALFDEAQSGKEATVALTFNAITAA